MAKFIMLSMVVGPARTDQGFGYDVDSGYEVGSEPVNRGEDDGIVQLHPEQRDHPAEEEVSLVAVNFDDVREFYPRKPDRDGRPRLGTRIVFKNGAGRPVTESFDRVRELVGIS
jgi:hypothetical protein